MKIYFLVWCGIDENVLPAVFYFHVANGQHGFVLAAPHHRPQHVVLARCLQLEVDDGLAYCDVIFGRGDRASRQVDRAHVIRFADFILRDLHSKYLEEFYLVTHVAKSYS